MEKTYLSSNENKLSPDLIDKNCKNYLSITWIFVLFDRRGQGGSSGPLRTHVCAK